MNEFSIQLGKWLHLLLMIATLATTSSRAAEGSTSKWTSLFDGHSLEGWIQRGGKAPYRAQDGVIVGTTQKGQPNSFLCTPRNYGDFILELEYLVDPSMNSGIQIRSQSTENGKRVFGYQIEIDPSKRAWSGGIYDEARRGWLYPLTGHPEAQNAFKQNEWNHYRVEAIGDRIRTWINGVPAADLVDSLNPTGFIALQVHGTGKDEPMEIKWRNIRIQDLGTHEWKPLFDGKTLSGWHPLPGGTWTVENGAIVGKSAASESRHGLLLSDTPFHDFTVRFQFRSLQGNSGFYFRAEPVNHAVSVAGFQAEIDPTNATGGLYETLGRTWVAQSKPEQLEKIYKKGEWNEMTVSAHGRRIVVHVNGHKTVELLDDPGRLSGHLGLQLHGGQDMHVEFKDIQQLLPQCNGAFRLTPIPPSNAIHLLASPPTNALWQTADGQDPNGWNYQDGVWTTQPHTPSMQTAFPVKDFQLHVEFNAPNQNSENWGNNGNSGLYLQKRYELQIINSYGRELTYQDNGSIYKTKIPDYDLNLPAGQWQTFDLVFRASRWDDSGKKIEDARISVLQNGVPIHRDIAIPDKTGAGQPEGPEALPLLLQQHSSVVHFRNLWISPLDLTSTPDTWAILTRNP